MPRPRFAALGLLVIASFVAPIRPADEAAAATGSIRPAGRAEITIYNDGAALVREPKTLSLPRGVSDLVLEDIPQRVDSTSIRLEGAGFRVRRQTYRSDLWTSERVFRQFLGDTIAFRYAGKLQHGLLAGIDGDELFIQRRDSSEALLIVRRGQLSEIEFPSKRSLRARPALSWEIESEKGGDLNATLSYLASGIEWTADYNAVLDADEKNVEWSGWATIANRTGRAFQDAKVTLVAGEVNRASGSPDRGEAAEPSPSAGAGAPASEVFAYHRYSVEGAMDLEPQGTVQTAIVSARAGAERRYRYDGATDGSKVRVAVEFGNEKASGLGVPLPAGRVRVYSTDRSGGRTLVGEDRIAHTAARERIRLWSGVAFDLVGERTRASHTRVSRNVTEDQFHIRLRNRGSKDAVVTVSEALFGNWEIVEKSADFRKSDADRAEFDVRVPAGKEADLTYKVRYTF
jgi:hypothetical protein